MNHTVHTNSRYKYALGIMRAPEEYDIIIIIIIICSIYYNITRTEKKYKVANKSRAGPAALTHTPFSSPDCDPVLPARP